MTAMEVVVNVGGDNANDDCDQHCCQVCGRTSRRSMNENENEPLLRCTRCKNTYYCSVECQRRDWTKGGHRQSCRNDKSQAVEGENNTKYGPIKPPPKKRVTHSEAQDALEELCLMAHGTTVAESYKLSQQAQDELSKKKALLQKQDEERIREQRIQKYKQEQRELKRQQKQAEGESQRLKNSNARIKDNLFDSPSSTNKDTHSSSELDRESSPTISAVPYVVEEMPGIQQYQLTLWIPTSNNDVDLNRLGVSARKLTPSGTHTLINVVVQHEEVESNSSDISKSSTDILFTGEFPRTINLSRITLSETSTNLATKSGSRSIGSNIGNSTTHDKNKLDGRHEIFIGLPFCAGTDGRIDGVAYTTEEGTQSGRHSSLDDVNSLVCGTCQLPVLLPTTKGDATSSHKEKNIIQSVKLLPKGHWDEIADYLICYSGEPIIDFTLAGTNAQRSVALEDDSTICFNMDDVGSSACVLAASDFHDIFDEGDTARQSQSTPLFNSSEQVDKDNGRSEQIPEQNSATANGQTDTVTGDSATIRGDRLWHDEAGEGGSVNLFCSQCCSALGFSSVSSPETWRFWKHRLSLPTNTNNSKPSFCRFSTTASFLVREMVRYAETKAIFTFVIHEKRTGNIGNPTLSSRTRRCLLLRLLSWETIMASSLHKDDQKNSKASKATGKSSTELKFRKVAKIVFEETLDQMLSKTNKKDVNGDSEDISKWIWGGVDLCCLPPKSPSSSNKRQDHGEGPEQLADSTEPTSTVRLGLPTEEYEEVKQNLEEGTMLLSQDVAKATILLQLGESRHGLKLTVLPRF